MQQRDHETHSFRIAQQTDVELYRGRSVALVIYCMQMSGYELNDKDIQTVLKHLRAVKPDATEEQAKELLLKAKMDARFKGFDDPDVLIQYFEELSKSSDQKN